jgi:hypothetical protein
MLLSAIGFTKNVYVMLFADNCDSLENRLEWGCSLL